MPPKEKKRSKSTTPTDWMSPSSLVNMKGPNGMGDNFHHLSRKNKISEFHCHYVVVERWSAGFVVGQAAVRCRPNAFTEDGL